jgi:C4-dicarboxylate-specific signal transduction histidine kinase
LAVLLLAIKSSCSKFINLVMNGIQARAMVVDRARVPFIRTQQHESDQVLVAVEDVGVGIDFENLNLLFGTFSR